MRISIPLLLLIFNLNLVQAQEEAAGNPSGVKAVSEKIAQKIKMVNLILHSADLLQRVEASDDSVARELLARAAENFLRGEEYFDRGQYLEAEAVLDYVLRDLSASARLLSVPQQKKSKYEHFIEQLDSFALPEWRDLDELENELLQIKLERISALRDQAIRQADAESYDEAMSMLEKAYRLKVSLLDEFRHETLVIYDLKFETVQDEYQYMVNRTYHYLELVQVAMAQGEVEEQTQKLADNYLYSSMLNLETAEAFETQGQFSKAISMLDKSINQLSAVLKLLGVKI